MTTAIARFVLLLALSFISPAFTANPSTVVNISPAVNQRIVLAYVNEQQGTTFAATLAAEMGDWFVVGTDGTNIDLPASAKPFEVTSTADEMPVVTLDGKKVKMFAYKKDVLATKRYAMASDVPAKDSFYLIINYRTSVITIEVKQKG